MGINEKITEALAKLDPDNDEQWTSEGLPRVEVVAEVAGIAALTRKEINEAGRGFTRDVARSMKSADADPEADGDDGDDPFGDTPTSSTEQSKQRSDDDADEPDEQLPETEVLRREYDRLKAEIEETEIAIAAAGKKRDELVVEAARVEERLAALVPPIHFSNMVQGWLASEHERRKARVEFLRERGLVALVGPSQIDQAMKRKTGFGQRRPDFTGTGKIG